MTTCRHVVRTGGVALILLALSSCTNFDTDFRSIGNGLDTSEAALAATASRPQPDNRGIISYPSYQVAIAENGDTVSDVAARVGVPAAELASFNGMRDGVPLRRGETLVLPGRVAEPTAASGAVDVAAVAGSAIERAGGVQTQPLDPVVQPSGLEPKQHRVKDGETAFSIARLYGVTPRALADWNGLNADLDVRTGQILLIPIVLEPQTTAAAATAETSKPGTGSVAPAPPSAATALPVADKPETPAPVPESPQMAEEKSDSSSLLMPVSGRVIRDFEKDKNNGIDVAAPSGTDVRAAAAGTVAAISRDTNGVLAVVVRHPDDLLTVYFGVKDETVSKDDKVSRGQVLGKVRDGDPSFLHFEVRRGFEPLDPMPFLN